MMKLKLRGRSECVLEMPAPKSKIQREEQYGASCHVGVMIDGVVKARLKHNQRRAESCAHTKGNGIYKAASLL